MQDEDEEIQVLAEGENIIKDGDMSSIRPDVVRIGFIVVIAIIFFFILKAAWSSSMKMNAPFVIFLIGLVSLLIVFTVFVIGI